MREGVRRRFRLRPPPDCSPARWKVTLQGLDRFVIGARPIGHASWAWKGDELYRVPELWSQIYLTGAALLVCGKRVFKVSRDNIVIEALAGSALKFRRIVGAYRVTDEKPASYQPRIEMDGKWCGNGYRFDTEKRALEFNEAPRAAEPFAATASARPRPSG